MHGEREIPFAMWWILLPLRDERVFTTVQEIVEKHTSIRPQWAVYKAMQERLRTLAPQVLAAQGRIAAEIERWEAEHRHKHPYSDAIGRIDAVMQD